MSLNAQHILDDVSRATNNLILEEPFYGHFFVGLIKEVSTRTETMAVGAEGSHVKLHVNAEFWTKRLTDANLKTGLIKHEILHVVLKHIFRHKDYKHKELFNIACDLVVNQYIREGALPSDRLHLGLFPELKLKPDMDAGYYYEQLLPPWEKVLEEETGDDGGEGGGSEETLKRLMDEGGEWLDRHKEWNALDETPNVMREVIEQGVTEAVRQALEKARGDKRWGNLPVGLRTALEHVTRVEKAAVNWRRVLRQFAESSSKTYLKNTIRRPSKRFGTTPGIQVRRRQRILLALDTSGSISEGELEVFFRELYHLWKRGAEIKVVECDAKIHREYVYRGQHPKEVLGGGGTDFNPPIVYGNQGYLPDALIYFTDGYAPPPEVKPRFPILWVITPQGIKGDSERFAGLPGRKVKLE